MSFLVLLTVIGNLLDEVLEAGYLFFFFVFIYIYIKQAIMYVECFLSFHRKTCRDRRIVLSYSIYLT